MLVAAIDKRVSSIEGIWHPQGAREPPSSIFERTRRLSMFETPNTLKTTSVPQTELYARGDVRPLNSCMMLGQSCAGEDLDEDIGLIDALEAINELHQEA